MPKREITEEKRMESSPTSAGNLIEDSTLDSETGLVEGMVAEVAPSALKNGANSASDDEGSDLSSTEKDDSLSQTADLRAKLLETAPAEEDMRREINSELANEAKRYEREISKTSKKDYHKMCDLLMKLRRVLREIQDLAKLRLEALQVLWLKLVHQFA